MNAHFGAFYRLHHLFNRVKFGFPSSSRRITFMLGFWSHRTEDAGTKRASREDEPDYNGEGPEYASTWQVTQDVLG